MPVIGMGPKSRSYKIYNHKYSFTAAYRHRPALQTPPPMLKFNIGEKQHDTSSLQVH